MNLKLAVLLALPALALAACAPDSATPVSCHQAAVTSANAITFNAIAFNAIAYNAISYNGLDDGQLELGCAPESLMVHEYLIGCALRADQSVTVLVDGAPHTLHGAIGLAPQWQDGPCDEDCQSWVSACLIARINARGESVAISLRGDHPGLDLAPGEAEAFPVAEARYYGAVFAEPPTAMACLLDGSGDLDRVCGDDPSCPVRVQGSCAELCDELGCRDRDGTRYHAVSVYREPGPVTGAEPTVGPIAEPRAETTKP